LPPQARFRLARGLDAPSGEVPPRSRAGRPPRARPRLDREPSAPSSDFPSCSRAGCPLGRGSASLGGWTPPRVRFRLARGLDAPLGRSPVSIESQEPPRASSRLARGHHGPAASICASPAGAFNALTSAGAQVKGESTPLRAWESCPGTAPPTPVARPSPPLCDAVRHGQHNPVALCHPLPYGRRAAPSRKDGGALEGKVNSYAAPVQEQRRDTVTTRPGKYRTIA
jgi:hypothetical protein